MGENGGRKRVLVVDDDQSLRELLEMELQDDFDVVMAEDGDKALEAAKGQNFDLILLDVMMPGKDGYHVAMELTNSQGANAPKILILTARDTVREKGIAIMSGAASMLQKPFTSDQLQKKIQEVLG